MPSHAMVASDHNRMLHLSFLHNCILLLILAPLYHVHRHYTTLLPIMASPLTRRVAAPATAMSSNDAAPISSSPSLIQSPNVGVNIC